VLSNIGELGLSDFLLVKTGTGPETPGIFSMSGGETPRGSRGEPEKGGESPRRVKSRDRKALTRPELVGRKPLREGLLKLTQVFNLRFSWKDPRKKIYLLEGR